MRQAHPVFYVLLWLLLSLLTLFPIYWLFVISVKPAVDLFTTPSLILDTFYWKNYVNVINNATLRGYMVNSLIISSGNAFLVTLLAFMACYALSRFDLAGKENIFFWTMTFLPALNSTTSSMGMTTSWIRSSMFMDEVRASRFCLTFFS